MPNWGPNLTPQELEDMEARLETIEAEADSYNQALDSLLNKRDLLQKAKDIDEKFFNYFNDSAAAYEDEYKALFGAYSSDTKLNITDLEDAVTGSTPATPVPSRLFPATYASCALCARPGFMDVLNGNSPLTLQDNEVVRQDFLKSLADGLAAGKTTIGSATTLNNGELLTLQPLGTQSVVNIGAIGVADGDYVSVIDSLTDDEAVLEVISGGGTTNVTVESLAANISSITAGAGNIGFSSDPTDLQNAADNAADILNTRLDEQISALSSNVDDITNGAADKIASAVASAGVAKTAYESWRASPTRFNAGELNNVADAVSARAFKVADRPTEVLDAVATPNDGIYDRRFEWTNTLVDRSTGSWTQLQNTEDGIALFQQNENTRAKETLNYEEYLNG